MANSRGPQGVSVETDFLFGLRETDPVHPRVQKALAQNEEGKLRVYVLGSAIWEVRTVLYSRGLTPPQVEEVVALIDELLAERDVRSIVTTTLSDVVIAERLRTEHRRLGFFDSLHAALTTRLGLPILTSDPVYASLGLPALDLRRF